MKTKEYIFYCAEKDTIITSSSKHKKFFMVDIDFDFKKSKKEAHEILIELLSGKHSRKYEYVRIGEL
jgi:hypothetical protein